KKKLANMKLYRFKSWHEGGDFIDWWSLMRAWNLPDDQLAVFYYLIDMAKYGTHVYLHDGNHDNYSRESAAFADFIQVLNLKIQDSAFRYGHRSGNFSFVLGEWVHTSLDQNGEPFDLLGKHGDDVDPYLLRKPWVYQPLGAWGRDVGLEKVEPLL